MPLLPTRVILAVDANVNYVSFWPVVARHWKQIHKIQPTLLFIGPESTPIDKTCGDVFFIAPIAGQPSSFTAQIARLLGPALFPEDVCVVADIDLFLLDNTFFQRYGLASIADTHFVSLNRYNNTIPHISMTYQVAKGKVFQQIFHCGNTIPLIQRQLATYGQGNIHWSKDEKLLTESLTQWSAKNPGLYHRIHTPGIWGGSSTVSRFQNCKYTPQQLPHLVELEPFHPLQKDLNLVRHILSVRNPGFQIPDLSKVYLGHNTGPSRHPEDKKKIAVRRAPGRMKIAMAGTRAILSAPTKFARGIPVPSRRRQLLTSIGAGRRTQFTQIRGTSSSSSSS